jgi:Holliday junction resolvase RusA-like endonuclease
MIYAVPFPPPKPAAIQTVADPGVVTFVVEGQPIPKQRPAFNSKTKKAYTPEETVAWEGLVAGEALVAMVGKEPLEGNLTAVLEFRRKDNKRADIDNLVKGFFDPMNGIVYNDDKQVVELHARVRYASADPGVTVTVKPAV